MEELTDISKHSAQTADGQKYYYVGQVQKDTKIKHGIGLCIWQSGDCYEGYLQNDNSHGLGRHIYSNGDIYEGRYVNCKKEGQGIMIYANGSRYEGNFKSGKKHGRGFIRHIDETITKIEYDMNKDITPSRRTMF